MNKTIVKAIWSGCKALGGAWLTVKFGCDAYYWLNALVLVNVRLGVNWLTIISQSGIPNLLMNMAAFLIMLELTSDQLCVLWAYVEHLFGRTQEEKDVEDFVRWMRKQSKRLRKLEGC